MLDRPLTRMSPRVLRAAGLAALAVGSYPGCAGRVAAKKKMTAKKKMAAKKKTAAKKKLAPSKKKTAAKKKLAPSKKKTAAKKKLAPSKKKTTAKKKLAPSKQAPRPAEKAALCSSRVVGPKRKEVLFAYRQEPDNDNDSGWRFLRGDESETFLADPKNCLVCPLSLVFEMDPSLEELTRSADGPAFRRASVEARWEPIGDYDPEA
ncbi:MAG: DUF2185 domain-containing protein [Myxococcales bacterium]|nr:DUF2185 domain-containing protein [Myxococcales bacterium]